MDDKRVTKKLSIALTMNALVLPGTGHMYMGRNVKGTVISILTIIFVFLPLVLYMITLNKHLRMLSPTLPVLKRSISSLSSAWEANSTVILVCLLAIFILWLYGILDLLLKNRNPKS